MGLFSLEKLFGITIRESATDGSDFTNPDADYRRLFLGEDGQLHVKDSAGSVTDIGAASGSVATDTLWDAKGDGVFATGANAAAKLTAGSNGMVPVYDSAQSNGVKTAYPPGYEFDYAEITTSATFTTIAAVVTGNAVTYDGSTVVIVKFFCDEMIMPGGASGNNITVQLFEDGSVKGVMGVFLVQNNENFRFPANLERRITPAAGSHTYSIRCVAGSGTGTATAGDGTGSNHSPAWIQITKAA